MPNEPGFYFADHWIPGFTMRSLVWVVTGPKGNLIAFVCGESGWREMSDFSSWSTRVVDPLEAK